MHNLRQRKAGVSVEVVKTIPPSKQSPGRVMKSRTLTTHDEAVNTVKATRKPARKAAKKKVEPVLVPGPPPLVHTPEVLEEAVKHLHAVDESERA